MHSGNKCILRVKTKDYIVEFNEIF